MKQTTRELLVTTKVAQSWRDDFDSNVDGLMAIVSKVDTPQQVDRATERMDVYRNSVEQQPSSSPDKKHSSSERPFDFTVFRN